jgi:hypothetical protein
MCEPRPSVGGNIRSPCAGSPVFLRRKSPESGPRLQGRAASATLVQVGRWVGA